VQIGEEFTRSWIGLDLLSGAVPSHESINNHANQGWGLRGADPRVGTTHQNLSAGP
jgi:hypothetical protein